MHWPSLALMQPSAAPEGMKKKRGPKKEYFHCAIKRGNGIPAIRGPSCGAFIMDVLGQGNKCAFFLSVIGLNWIFGHTSNGKICSCRPFIFLMKDVVSAVVTLSLR